MKKVTEVIVCIFNRILNFLFQLNIFVKTELNGKLALF